MGFVIFIIVIAILFGIINGQQQQELYKNYQNALRSRDKKLALELGRKYYASKRPKGKLTIYDEQAITNDLSTMN